MKRRAFLKTALAPVTLAVSAASLSLRATVTDICSKVGGRQRAMKLPPLPKWNKTTDDIDSADFLRRCLDSERALLPCDLVFPRAGQIWEAVHDCEVHAPMMIGPQGAGDPAERATSSGREDSYTHT